MKYLDDEYYHIFNRGARKARIFFVEENYFYCLRLLKKHSLQQSVSILAYCLMPNHYHIVCRQETGGSTSKFLQNTFNAYSQAVNKQQGYSGTLFEGKAQAKHINSDAYVLQVVRYLHLNPVEARLVEKADEWKFSDYVDWITEPSEDSNPSGGLILRNAYFKNGTAYREFVETYKEEKDKAGIKHFLFNE